MPIIFIESFTYLAVKVLEMDATPIQKVFFQSISGNNYFVSALILLKVYVLTIINIYMFM